MEISPEYIYRCRRTLIEMDAPVTDWKCERVWDIGSAKHTCELCGCKKVRYIHVMRHDQYSGSIQVGCICAGIMEGDILAAKERDARARRKSNYLKKQWTDDGDGRWKVRYKRRTIIIERDSFYGHEYYKIKIGEQWYPWKNSRRMKSFLEAQHFVFDLIEWEEKGDA